MLLVRVDILRPGHATDRLVTAHIENVTGPGSTEVEDYVARVIQNGYQRLGTPGRMSEVTASGFVRADGPAYLVSGILGEFSRHVVRNNARFALRSPETNWQDVFVDHGTPV